MEWEGILQPPNLDWGFSTCRYKLKLLTKTACLDLISRCHSTNMNRLRYISGRTPDASGAMRVHSNGLAILMSCEQSQKARSFAFRSHLKMNRNESLCSGLIVEFEDVDIRCILKPVNQTSVIRFNIPEVASS